jgi:hypothetical protein
MTSIMNKNCNSQYRQNGPIQLARERDIKQWDEKMEMWFLNA